jgi:hypothetical protein
MQQRERLITSSLVKKIAGLLNTNDAVSSRDEVNAVKYLVQLRNHLEMTWSSSLASSASSSASCSSASNSTSPNDGGNGGGGALCAGDDPILCLTASTFLAAARNAQATTATLVFIVLSYLVAWNSVLAVEPKAPSYEAFASFTMMQSGVCAGDACNKSQSVNGNNKVLQGGVFSWKALCQELLCLCRHACSDGRDDLNEVKRLQTLFLMSETHFRLQTALEKTAGGRFFRAPSLSESSSTRMTTTMMGSTSRASRIESIVNAAESESGQQILRDLMISFTVPVVKLQLRRSFTISQSTINALNDEHSIQLQQAHHVAMTGVNYVFAHSDDPIERMCCFLAGLGVLLTKGDIRKDFAFSSRVVLPFFEVDARSDALRMYVDASPTTTSPTTTSPDDALRTYCFRLKKELCVSSCLPGIEGLFDSGLELLKTL